MAAGEIRLWPPTSTTLQRLERAPHVESIRAGLELIDGLPFSREWLSDGLIRLTGGQAFGPAGRPANTILVGRERIVVVDPSDPDEEFIDLIEAEAATLGGRIVGIALTHVDPGHASGSQAGASSSANTRPMASTPTGAARRATGLGRRP